ncbi:MAG TPA: HlyD family secretion protein, partial [Planctomycetota bacterium]|nr:HlyD family secretion protein [Planctomycetota bacterium]
MADTSPAEGGPAQAEGKGPGAEPARKEPAKRRGPARVVLLVALAAGLVAGAVYGTRYWLHSRTHETTDDAFLEGHIVRVSPRVAGHVLRVFFQENQAIEAGAPLLE